MKNWLSSSSFFRAQRLIILALVVVLSLQQAQGATITVPPGSTLSSVLAGSANGDVLQLQSGTYYVTAQVNLTDSGARSIIGAGAQSTIIVPSSSNSFTRFVRLSGGSLTIENVALRDFSRDPAQLGDSVLAGSVFQVAGGTLTLNNCQATDNNAQEQDGGVLATWSGANKQIIISDCVFDSNQASHGSALAMLGVAEAATVTVTDSSFTSHINTVHGVIFLNTDTNADVTLTRLTFRNNVGSDRGVLHNDSGSITVTDSYFGGNVADSGATISLGPAAQFQAINCTFERNQARAGGGCVRSTTSFPITFKQCVFLYNSAPNQAGAIEVDQPYYLIDECYFEGNSAPLGGAFLAPPNAGSAPITSNLITRSVFVNNIGSTGGAAIWASIAIRVSNCTFINNTAGSGGAILQNNQAIWLSDSYFTGNSARNGGAIFSTSDAEFHFFGSIEIIKNKASTLGGGMLLSGSAIIETGAVVHVANNSVNTGGGGVALADITDFVVEGQLLIEHNRAVLGAGLYVDAASYAACSVNTTEQTLLLNNNRAVIGGGGAFFATSTLSVDCPHINATFTDNVAPYGVDEGSYPSIIDWELVVPNQIRVGEHFTQTGQLLDIFSKPVRAASTLLSFEMSIIANNKSKPEQVSLVSLVGLTTTAPRDLDGALRFRPFVTGSSGAQLPMSFSLAIVSRPQLLPTQYFDITLTTCEGGYTSYVVDGELFCLELITASDWARAVAGAAAGVGLLVVGFMWLLLFIKPDKMVHFGRTASVACLHAVCLGSFVILISIFPWMEDNDSNCVARPWLAVIGLAIMLSGLFVISFADFLRSQQRSPSDLIMLIIVLTLSLIANIVVLIVWTAQDPYELLQEVGLASNTLKQYCYSSDTVYIWILVGFYAGLGALYLLSLFLQRNLSFRFRQSKHFSLYSLQAAAVSAAMIPVAAVYFTDLDVFFLVTTLGLVGVAVLPVIPLVGLRVYRVFYPMEGDRRNQHVEWLIKDHRHRQSQVTQIASGSTAHTSSPHLPATESIAYSRNNSRNTRTL